MKKYVNELEVGDKVQSYFAVKYKKAPIEYERGYRFVVGLSDKTGEIEMHYWGGEDEEEVKKTDESFEVYDVVEVKGVVGSYRDSKKIDVNEKDGIRKTEEYDILDFIGKSPKDYEQMKKEFDEIIESIEEGYRVLVKEVLKKYPEFYEWPASMYRHHNYIHGLLEHTLNMLKLAVVFAQQYELDRDLLLAGVALHDIGKIKELEYKTAIKVGEEGMLVGHVMLGEEIVKEVGRSIGTEERKLNKIRHIILSHHGKKSFGAPKEPQFPEAVAVHYIDMLDSQTIQYIQAIKNTNSEDFRIWSKGLGEIYLK